MAIQPSLPGLVTVPTRSTKNRILTALPEWERDSLFRSAKLVECAERHTFYTPASPPEHGYFLEAGMASELIRMRTGKAADAAPIGVEGFVGMQLLLNPEATFHECVVQLPGRAWRIPADHAWKAFQELPRFRTLMLRYAHARFVQATQCSACNLLHSLHQRLGRWMMLAYQHANTKTLKITQVYLSEMLGANRTTVTLALGEFQRAGMISYSRGLVQITNLEALNDASCECNAVIGAAMDQIFR